LIDAIVRLTAIGLALLTVGIGSAVMMTERPAAAHFGLAALVWAGYVAMLGLHAGKKIGPKRTAALAIGVFLLPLVMLAAG
ncbi:MAG: hypothetical protein KDN19_24220, partial [Verrucomicrobiae bacterium]|nr:hypothetical protein [Verrucomicrobiae bacterium]